MQNIYVIQLQRNELGIWEVYAMSEELQKIIDEQAEKIAMETKKEFVKISLEEKLPIEIIKKLAKVNEQFIYNVANENNLQVKG